MIYVELALAETTTAENAIFEVDGERFSGDAVSLPYAVEKALAHGRNMQFLDAAAGLRWLRRRYPRTQLPIARTRCCSSIMSYFNLDLERDDRRMKDVLSTLPAVPDIVETYRQMELYMILNDIPLPSSTLSKSHDPEAFRRVTEWVTGSDLSGALCNEQLLGYKAETISRILGRPVSQQELDRTNPASLAQFWQNVDFAAKIAMDSLGAVTIDIAQGQLSFSAEQVVPGYTHLGIALLDGTSLYFAYPKLKGSQLFDKRGKVLTQSRLVGSILSRLTLQHCRAIQLAKFTNTKPKGIAL